MVPLRPEILLEHLVNLIENQTLSVALDHSSSSPFLHFLSPHTSLPSHLLSQLLNPSLNITGLYADYIHICELIRRTQNLQFLEGLIQSTPWKMFINQADELGSLPNLQCKS